MDLKPQEIALSSLKDKYCKGLESTPDDVRQRVACALAALEDDPAYWEPVFLNAQRHGIVMAGRINSAAGTGLGATWINCFAQPIADSIQEPDDDGFPGIYVALKEATETMRRSGGVGYSFSRLRPRGALVKKTGSDASGPVSYMRVFDESCATVSSSGARRGAQMALLRCDHPDVEEFIHAKDAENELTNFNISVAVTDEFIQSVIDDGDVELIHKAEPCQETIDAGAYQRKDGMWVYRKIKANKIWEQIMLSTYDHGEPGVVYIDRVNTENSLGYCEIIEATNPCAEQPLPPYGCCDLASINLTTCVNSPFAEEARFDWESFVDLVHVGVRMLDNVLEGTPWPLEQQRVEAHNKRRIGLGFLGLGNTLAMLGLRYDSEDGRKMAAQIAEKLRDEAYRASIDLAKERGSFPLFDAEKYCASPFIKRLPAELQAAIKENGIRNSHLTSIAPTGTISLAFADNASNGIEPSFAYYYERQKKERNGEKKKYFVEDHAFRVFRALNHLENVDREKVIEQLPDSFVTALEISANDHALMVSTVQKYIDSAISKTVNVPKDYPYEDFKDLYINAWKNGAKSLATFRPNDVTGSVLSEIKIDSEIPTDAPADFDESNPDRRLKLEKVPEYVLNSVRWNSRPSLPNGNPSHTYAIEHPNGAEFSVFVGHIENGKPYPFEVWVNGAEVPRGLNALAKNLSFDMYSRDRAWLKTKLESLVKTEGNDAFMMKMPPDGDEVLVPSVVSAFAHIVLHRCSELGAFQDMEDSPVLNALMSPKEPKTEPTGTFGPMIDVLNPNTGDDFVLGLKELQYEQDGVTHRRPYSVWLSGVYPRVLDGLCKSLSLDMRVIDPAWIGRKLQKLVDFPEPMGNFFAKVPGKDKSKMYPSTVAYIASLIIHRFAVLGILDEQGNPVNPLGVIEIPEVVENETDATKVDENQPNVVHMKHRSAGAQAVTISSGQLALSVDKLCPDCSTYSLIRADGCKRCTHKGCGYIGDCG